MRRTSKSASHWPYSLALERVLVVGSTCAGKSTFARALAAQLSAPVIELDALHWGPNWMPKPAETFRQLVADAAQGSRWIAEGNYRGVREILWPRAGTVFWLNYPFHVVVARALRRAALRSWHRQVLWHGNRESFARSFMSRESILLYVFRNWARRRRLIAELRASGAYAHLTWIEFQKPRQAEEFLGAMSRHDASTQAA